MPTPIDPKRLPRLRASRKRFKPGEKLPQQELADIYGVSNARFTTLIHDRFEDFPKPERHGDKTHWYEAVPAIDAMISYLQATTRTRRAAASRVAAVLGHVRKEADEAPAPDPPRGELEPQPLGPAELDRLASAQTRVFRLEQEKGLFVRKGTAQSVVRDLFQTVQRGVSALPMEIDPNGELPPLHRARLEAAVRDSMVRIHNSVREFLGDGA